MEMRKFNFISSKIHFHIIKHNAGDANTDADDDDDDGKYNFIFNFQKKKKKNS